MKTTAALLLAALAIAPFGCEETTDDSTMDRGTVSGTTTDDRVTTPPATTPPANTTDDDMDDGLDDGTRDADNTGINERDRDDNNLTPTDQLENEADREVTAAVRRAIVDDSTLSVNAHNIKIITANGVVTLRGPVKSQAEKDAIEAKAKAVAGVTSVDNQLEIENP
jgi:osmotically-inducible protein OsmY